MSRMPLFVIGVGMIKSVDEKNAKIFSEKKEINVVNK